MRKVSFYPKLAIGNLVRNRTTYLPYLLACVVSVFTFYTLLSITSSGQLGALPGGYIVEMFTNIALFVLGIFSIILIFYTNSFLIKRRKKELGLYSILGMEKSNIGVIMLLETLLVSFIAVLLGIISGILLGRLFYMILIKLVRLPASLELPVSFVAISGTIVFFGIVFMLTLVVNLWQVKVASPIQLLSGAKQGEKEPKASWFTVLLGLVCTGAGYAMAIVIQDPVTAVLLFLVAALLVIIGTFCLFRAGSIALLKVLRRNKNYYYSPKHFISVSGMIYRMKQNAAGLASICILSCMALVTVSSTAALYIGSEDSLNTMHPYDFAVTANNHGDTEMVVAGAEALAQRHGFSLIGLRTHANLDLLLVPTEDGYVASYDGYEPNYLLLNIMLLEDYNRIAGTNYTLQPGEILRTGEANSTADSVFRLDGVDYAAKPVVDVIGVEMNGTVGAAQSGINIVMADETAVWALVDNTPDSVQQRWGEDRAMNASITFDTDGTPEQQLAFYADFQEYLKGTPKAGGVYIKSKADIKLEWYVMNGAFIFVGMYFGLLFLMATAMIIYYKQISEGFDDRERYIIMQKVGMSNDEVKKSIQGQIRAVFFSPLLVAIVHIGVAFNSLSHGLTLFGVFNTALLVQATIASILVYALIYWLVYRSTARSYYRIVRRAE